MNNCLNCVCCDKRKVVAPGEAWCNMIDEAVVIQCCGNQHTMTNGDRIRQMSNEEIVDWLGGNDGRLCSFSCPPCQVECNDDCRGCWLDWLNSEYKEKKK